MIDQSGEISFERFSEILSTAFLPLECICSSEDHGNEFSLKIIRDSNPILNVTHYKSRRVTVKRAKTMINETRNYLSQRGCDLKPWRFPAQDSTT